MMFLLFIIILIFPNLLQENITTYGPNKSHCLADTPYKDCIQLSSCCYTSHSGEGRSFNLCVNIFSEANKSIFCNNFVEEVKKEGYSPLSCECKDYVYNLN